MPVYDYKCIDCGEIVEVFHRVDDCIIRLCGDCLLDGKESEMQKQLPISHAIHFKGSGFYETDYKSK